MHSAATSLVRGTAYGTLPVGQGQFNPKEHGPTRNGSSGVAVIFRVWNALNEIADFHTKNQRNLF